MHLFPLRPHHRRRTLDIRFAHGRAGGEAQAIPEERRGHATPRPRREGAGEGDFAALEHRLQVHRLPQRTGFDGFSLQRQSDRFTIVLSLRGHEAGRCSITLSLTPTRDLLLVGASRSLDLRLE